MTQCLSRSDKNKATKKLKSLRYWQNEIQEYLDPPKPLNVTLGLFFGGYFLAIISVWQWYQGNWPLPILVALAFLALHMEGTVIHDACHNAAHPNKWINQFMGHGSAILLGF